MKFSKRTKRQKFFLLFFLLFAENKKERKEKNKTENPKRNNKNTLHIVMGKQQPPIKGVEQRKYTPFHPKFYSKFYKGLLEAFVGLSRGFLFFFFLFLFFSFFLFFLFFLPPHSFFFLFLFDKIKFMIKQFEVPMFVEHTKNSSSKLFLFLCSFFVLLFCFVLFLFH